MKDPESKLKRFKKITGTVDMWTERWCSTTVSSSYEKNARILMNDRIDTGKNVVRDPGLRCVFLSQGLVTDVKVSGENAKCQL